MCLRKKINVFLAVALTAITTSAYKFPDELPDWQELQSSKFNILRIGATTIDSFVKSCPGLSKKILPNHITIFEEDVSTDNKYQNIRIGFQYSKLDWVELTLKQNIKVDEFVDLYGKPFDVNNTYSDTYDYYNYGFFNVSTDKQHEYAYHITIFDLPAMQKDSKKTNLHLPDYYSFNFSQVLKPGQMLESSFLDKFNGLIPFKKDRFDTTSIYSLTKAELTTDLYDQVTIVFKNGLLNFVSLSPVDLKINDVVKRYGDNYKTESMSNNRTYFDYQNFVMVVDNSTKKVLKVGIVGVL